MVAGHTSLVYRGIDNIQKNIVMQEKAITRYIHTPRTQNRTPKECQKILCHNCPKNYHI